MEFSKETKRDQKGPKGTKRDQKGPKGITNFNYANLLFKTPSNKLLEYPTNLGIRTEFIIPYSNTNFNVFRWLNIGGNQSKAEKFASSLFLLNRNAAMKKTTIVRLFFIYHRSISKNWPLMHGWCSTSILHGPRSLRQRRTLQLLYSSLHLFGKSKTRENMFGAFLLTEKSVTFMNFKIYFQGFNFS